jgi:AcrR family transcriptional regulator
MSIKELEKKQDELKKQIHKKKREQIIDLAYEMFQKRGIETTTVDQIAKKAGISKGTLYNHYFNRKESILLEISIRAYKKLTEMFQKARDRTKPGIEQVTEMGMQYYKFARKYPIYRQTFDLAESLLDISELKGRKSPEQLKKTLTTIEQFQKVSMGFVKVWADIIANAQKVGGITSKYTPIQLAHVLGTITTGLVDEILQRTHLTKSLNFDSDEQVLKIALSFLKNGLHPTKGK